MFSSRLIVVALSLVALSGCVSIKQVLPPSGREVAGGRNQLVTVTQNEIIAGIQESNMTAAAGGGLLFALIDAGVNQARTKTAEQSIVPVRDALTDYTFDQKALAASEALGANVLWLGVTKTEINKDPSNARFSTAIDQSPGPQLLSVTYDYLLDNGFQVLKVGANVSLLPKAVPKNGKPEQRAYLVNAAFARTFICVVPLAGAIPKALDQNAALWAKDGGKLAEQGIDNALAKLTAIIGKGLEFTTEQEKAIKKTKNQKLEGFVGKVIETDKDGTLLLTNLGQWVYVFKAQSSG